MFSLDLPTEARWLELPHGVRVLVKPLDGLVYAAARNHARAAIQKLVQARAEREAANAPAQDIPDVSDDAMRAAIIDFELARGLARYGVIDFAGVGDDADEPMPFSPARAEALVVHPEMLEPFIAAYTAPLERIEREGNAPAPAPLGSTAAGANTVPDASPPAPTAPPN